MCWKAWNFELRHEHTAFFQVFSSVWDRRSFSRSTLFSNHNSAITQNNCITQPWYLKIKIKRITTNPVALRVPILPQSRYGVGYLLTLTRQLTGLDLNCYFCSCYALCTCLSPPALYIFFCLISLRKNSALILAVTFVGALLDTFSISSVKTAAYRYLNHLNQASPMSGLILNFVLRLIVDGTVPVAQPNAETVKILANSLENFTLLENSFQKMYQLKQVVYKLSPLYHRQ